MSKILVKVPKPDEQRKIAGCLGSLDGLIDLQGRGDGLLETHGKGPARWLFSREGESVPRLRFPEFRDSGEWEVGRLSDEDIATLVKEKMPVDQLAEDAYISTENLLPDYGGVTNTSRLPSSGSCTK